MAWIVPGWTREVDAVVGDDAREPLDDVAQLDGRRTAAAVVVTAVFLADARDVGVPDARRPAVLRRSIAQPLRTSSAP